MEIELPDGTVLDAPDGADIKSVVAGYRLSQTKLAARQAAGASSGLEKFGVGIADPFVRTALGVKTPPVNLDVDEQGGLIGTDSGEPALTDDDKATLARLSQMTGPAATAGRVVGNVAMLAAPGGVVGAGMSALPRTMALRGLAMAGGDAAANAGTAALQAPEDGQTRGGNAGLAALGSVGGSALGSVVKGVPSAAFQDFMDFADKVLPSGVKGAIGLGSTLGPLHYVAPSVAHVVDTAVGALGSARYLGNIKPIRNFATGETAAQKYLQSALPSTIDYLSQAGAGAAEGTNQ